MCSTVLETRVSVGNGGGPAERVRKSRRMRLFSTSPEELKGVIGCRDAKPRTRAMSTGVHSTGAGSGFALCQLSAGISSN